ncbi:uncharacterized protein B0H64DRAFT_440383 [Chaetomium fimeti]|uniref:GDP/GTP exchange factor Sec2 N-terminal domain-containing protein n=1 Tax=Chaetomium fimeti TaxID=1854472 RepID=A0AAE0HI23_9PEZI|nr:hypothetical protein B0H64DRAFT_440383 [Chaetomium fimeti]
MVTVASPSTLRTAPTQTPCCPNCGFGADLPPFEDTQTALLDAQKHISDLQAQVRLLNQKASAAVDRWADYEDEIAKLRAQLDTPPPADPLPVSSNSGTTATDTKTNLPPDTAQLSSRPAVPLPIARLLPHHQRSNPHLGPALPQIPTSSRGTTTTTTTTRPAPSPIPSLPSSASYPPNTNNTNPHPHPSNPNHPTSTSTHLTPSDLLSALSREQALRAEAEGRLSETSREVEELSASLFEQANEMVASERRARARLEQRVGELERREGDKRRRLERLERAVGRIERVRGVLGELQGGLEGAVVMNGGGGARGSGGGGGSRNGSLAGRGSGEMNGGRKGNGNGER